MTTDDGIGSIAEAISEEADPQSTPEQTAAEKWPSALVTLLSARVAILSAEMEAAMGVVVTKSIFAGVAALTSLLAWLLLVAGLIGGIPAISSLEWYHVAFIVAALHIIVAIVAVLLLRKKTHPLFTMTKSEFRKDKQWLTSVKYQSTSKN